MDDEQPGDRRSLTAAHVLVFPLPAQGHINSMLRLSEILLLSGLHVTFLNTHHNHARVLHSNGGGAAGESPLGRHPRFRFKSISDGLPDDNPRAVSNIMEHFSSLSEVGRPQLLELLSPSKDGWPPVTCVVADGVLSFAVDVCREVGVPAVAFRTVSACSFWVYFSAPHLIETGELPFPVTDFGGGDLDELVRGVQGMDGLLRRRDLPICFRTRDIHSDPMVRLVMTETHLTSRASALLLNTSEALEGPVLSLIRSHIPSTYVVGPLHALLREPQQQSRPSSAATTSNTSRMSLWEEDRACVAWLDARPPRSVLYVSFGSLAVVTREQLEEFCQGLVNSGVWFLWVLRPDMADDVGLPEIGGRGQVVSWAPQEEVLDHPAVGGFLTHSGWNSTLESMVAGVPMVCWPYFADQQVNSRYVSEVWRVGLDMKDKWDRGTVERMARDVMEGEKAEELRRAAYAMADELKSSVRVGGSSYLDFHRLVEDIKLKRLKLPSGVARGS